MLNGNCKDSTRLRYMTKELAYLLKFFVRHVLQHDFSPHIPFSKLFRADWCATL